LSIRICNVQGEVVVAENFRFIVAAEVSKTYSLGLLPPLLRTKLAAHELPPVWYPVFLPVANQRILDVIILVVLDMMGAQVDSLSIEGFILGLVFVQLKETMNSRNKKKIILLTPRFS